MAGETRHWARWSTKEKERLRLSWGVLTLPQLASSLGRTEISTYAMARQMKLTRAVPQGTESLWQAAQRTGFAVPTLKRILRQQGVAIRQWMARPCSKTEKRSRSFHVVDSGDVDEAIERWAREEPVEFAAKRLGVCGETMKKLLVRAGHQAPKRKHEWRIPPELADQLVEEYRTRLQTTATVRQHALRLGLDRATLARRLRLAGVLGPPQPGVAVRLPVEVVDQVASTRRAA